MPSTPCIASSTGRGGWSSRRPPSRTRPPSGSGLCPSGTRGRLHGLKFVFSVELYHNIKQADYQIRTLQWAIALTVGSVICGKILINSFSFSFQLKFHHLGLSHVGLILLLVQRPITTSNNFEPCHFTNDRNVST